MSNLYVWRINADTPVDVNSNTYIVDASSNNVTLTLPDVNEIGDGLNFLITRVDNNTLTTVSIDPQSALINGTSGVKQLDIQEHVHIVVESYNWYTIGGEWL